MTHEFKVGDTVIVLPNGSKESFCNPFELVKIVRKKKESSLTMIVCKSFKSLLPHHYFRENQIAPLPIPYSQLDEE